MKEHIWNDVLNKKSVIYHVENNKSKENTAQKMRRCVQTFYWYCTLGGQSSGSQPHRDELQLSAIVCFPFRNRFQMRTISQTQMMEAHFLIISFFISFSHLCSSGPSQLISLLKFLFILDTYLVYDAVDDSHLQTHQNRPSTGNLASLPNMRKYGVTPVASF